MQNTHDSKFSHINFGCKTQQKSSETINISFCLLVLCLIIVLHHFIVLEKKFRPTCIIRNSTFIYFWENLPLWQYRLWSFQTRGTKLERFLPKNQHTQRKLLNFENWVNGEVSKVPKFDQNLTFKVNFLCQKLSESFSIFFSLKNINLGAHFLLLTFFDNINF